MSIATKTGDGGTTGLLYGSRVKKTDSRIAAVGDIDELCAAIGLTKAALRKTVMSEYCLNQLTSIQRTLTFFMGEVACEPAKRQSYTNKYDCVTEENLTAIEKEIERLEKDPNTKQTDWVMYGHTEIGAHCDFAGKVCRRAERSFSNVCEQEQLENPEELPRVLLAKYINRLSDMFHLLARYFDSLDSVKKPTIYRYE